MNSILIITHIIFMTASLLLMPAAIGLALNGVRASVRLATVGVFLATTGSLLGAMLLFDSLLSLQCAALTAYLLVMIGVYGFGFGWGRIRSARLLKLKA